MIYYFILRFAFKSPREIGNCFYFKDRFIDVKVQSLVIYHVKCSDCVEDYNGKTERILIYLIQEHKGVSSNKIDYTIHEHQLATSHKIKFDNVKIIDRADSD